MNNNTEFEDKSKGSYKRLSKFIWDRSYVNKAIMTIPYNSSAKSMKKYVTESLVRVDREDSDCTLYSDSEKNVKTLINDKDVSLLISSLKYIIETDFEKIRNLVKYLKNVAYILSILELPITWTLPTGLTIKQSYLESKSTSITPFMHSKIKINLKISVKNKYDKNKFFYQYLFRGYSISIILDNIKAKKAFLEKTYLKELY